MIKMSTENNLEGKKQQNIQKVMVTTNATLKGILNNKWNKLNS